MSSCTGLIPMLYSTIDIIGGSAECSLSHKLKASHGGYLHFKENIFFNSVMTFNNPKMDWYNILYLNYGNNVTFNYDYVLTLFNDYFANICNCVTGFVSNRLKAFMLQIAV